MNFVGITYANDTAAIDASPSDEDRYIGAAFEPQIVQGIPLMDNVDDRVSYLADIDTLEPTTISIGLGDDPNGDGDALQQTYGGTSIFGGVQYAERMDDWYDTLRPTAGFPLPAVSDIEYSNATGDFTGGSVNEDTSLLIGDDVRMIDEKPKQHIARLSEHPIEVQHERPWDVALGQWPWTGDKAALSRPVAASPMQFKTPLEDAIASPTGTSNADGLGTADLSPRMVTYRFVPAPWDTTDDGYYVDSGT